MQFGQTFVFSIVKGESKSTVIVVWPERLQQDNHLCLRKPRGPGYLLLLLQGRVLAALGGAARVGYQCRCFQIQTHAGLLSAQVQFE